MYVLVFAPQGIVGEYGSKAILCDTHNGAYYEMFRQVQEYIKDNKLEYDDYAIDSDHATAGTSDPCAPEWHIYEV